MCVFHTPYVELLGYFLSILIIISLSLCVWLKFALLSLKGVET